MLDDQDGLIGIPIYPGTRKEIMDYLVPADGELNKRDKLHDAAKNLVASEGEEVKKKVKEFTGSRLSGTVINEDS